MELKVAKEASPLKAARYAVANKISGEPAFRWWVPYVAGAYLNAPCAEKVYTILGEEFGDYAGRKAIIRMALYGLKSAGYSWRSFCARVLREELNFISCRADMDVWRRAAKKRNGTRYYEYLFIYTDDIIAISEDPKRILDKMNKHFLFKRRFH